MENVLKDSRLLIIILFVLLTLPFNVEAKEYNGTFWEEHIDKAEFISGDDVSLDSKYIPVDDQEFDIYNEDKAINFEYYIIDSIDSKGNIKYKKYDFSKAEKRVWYPDGYLFHRFSGGSIIDASGESLLESFNSCKKDNIYKKYDLDIFCRIVLPAINGKTSRWKFDSIEYGDKKEIDVCRYKEYGYYFYSSCDKTIDKAENTYVGTYEYYTSYVYKFYEIPDEKPQLKVTCDTNKLSKGETTKCRVNFSYKYMLRNVLFNITSDKLKISNFKVADDLDWDSSEIDNGMSLKFLNNSKSYYIKDKKIATFDVSSDSDVNNVLASLRRINFRYIDRLGENTLSDASFDVDLENEKDNIVNKDNIENKDNIINPSTFRDNYYLVIGILIVGLICFIQMKSKAKSK